MTVIPRLEGFVSTYSDVLTAPQGLSTFAELCKAVMRQQSLRDQTDWELYHTAVLTTSEETIDASAATVYGIAFINGAGDTSTLGLFDAANPTVAIGDLNDGGNLRIALVAAASTIKCAVFPEGIPFSTALTIAAMETDEGSTGISGTALVVYRSN
jgi:hypothetical protein